MDGVSNLEEGKAANEHIFDWKIVAEKAAGLPMETYSTGTSHIRYVVNIEKQFNEQGNNDVPPSIQSTLETQSDLVPNVYEGGMKVWECSQDLTSYLASLDIAFRGLRVLELGCGAGLPGILALKSGAHVDFQDYNEDVLEWITAPSVHMSHSADSNIESCRFFSGDWQKLNILLTTEIGTDERLRYDIILTSETIYNRDSYMKLLDLMKAVLKPSGKIYLAAKTYYFGVGGGTRDFEEAVKTHGDFNVEVCYTVEEGVNREILMMQPVC